MKMCFYKKNNEIYLLIIKLDYVMGEKDEGEYGGRIKRWWKNNYNGKIKGNIMLI